MFICDQDLKDHYKNRPSFFRSIGTCEICGKQKECSDIPSSALVSKFKPALQEVNNFTDDEFQDTELAQRWRNRETNTTSVLKDPSAETLEHLYVQVELQRIKRQRNWWIGATIACITWVIATLIFHK